MEKPRDGLLLFNKPYRVLTRFTRGDDQKQTLGDFMKVPDFYPIGRLDYDSEGLLLLTNWNELQTRIAHPNGKVEKTYYAQVEGTLTDAALTRLQRGVTLNDGLTLPADARATDAPAWLWPRDPPIRFRREIPTSWLALTICEGRNRQVRRMTAAVGFPTLRLIRWAVGPWTLEGITPGEMRDVPLPEVHRFLAR